MKIIIFWVDVQCFAFRLLTLDFKVNGKELLKQQETCLNSIAICLIQHWSLRSPVSLAGNCNSVILVEVESTSGNFSFQL